jgi:RimJ/RimL family protein N-acetyltransferase
MTACARLVRPIRETDIAAFRDAVGVVRAERKYILPGPPHSIEKTRAFVMGNIAVGCPQWIVEDNGQLVGWCDITRPSDNEAFQHVGRLGMGLLPEARGRGLGEPLLRATIEAGWAFGFKRIQLEVFATNARAIALYRKVGFADEGVRRHALCIDGVFIDEILMAQVRGIT